jgi:hypothetical protein
VSRTQTHIDVQCANVTLAPPDLQSLHCQSCGAALRVSGLTARCPYCASPNVIQRAPRADAPTPTFALAFALAQGPAATIAQRWKRSRGLFTHSGVKNAPIEDMRGVYLPAYLYSAVARAAYSASIGENYTETETYTTTENGKTVTNTRTVTKTEWRPLSGAYASFVRDVVVTASRGVPNADLERIEPFDLRALRRFAPALVSGWTTEDPTTSLDESLTWARGEASTAVGQALERFMPGDTHSGLQYQLTVENESIDLVLVPVWVFAVRYRPDKPPVRLLVNGQTGAAFGRAPLSALKVTLAIVIPLLLIAAAIGAYYIFGDAG